MIGGRGKSKCLPITTTSTSASTSRRLTVSLSLSLVPTAAPTNNLNKESIRRGWPLEKRGDDQESGEIEKI